ncbi:protein disulfide-isomerase [Hydrogenophilus thermoluteolus]|uniref:DsbC family protein n=1 Tax=Hydrogenophilus thermoluteolus TaxID=297 RepID=UPI0024A5B910|nr:DsbC family protein [Hydrogenophilus thermoluteolus]GLW61538.1 protein disulfide-isomerase [Hydrogenophilus thermoluteolus]
MRKLVATLAAISFSSAALAGVAEVEKRLKERYPSTQINEVRESVIAGLYEVVMGRNIAYTDETGRYVLFGHIFDMQAQKDLTAERLEEINKIDVASLPLEDAIKIVKGDGSRKLYVFSDPDCPFCQRLERETLPKIDNVTIYTFLFPLEGLHPDAKRKAEAIWCAKDRAKAWEAFMREGKMPEEAKCDNPIERNIQLGERLGFNGTPTILLEDGKVIPGFLPAEQLEQRMSGEKR